jgi:hypothetical protein
MGNTGKVVSHTEKVPVVLLNEGREGGSANISSAADEVLCMAGEVGPLTWHNLGAH